MKKGTNPDYVAYGSDRHAAQLGLKEAEEDDEPVLDGWALADATLWGPQATENFLKVKLHQLVGELNASVVEMQDKDPSKPNYAPPMWVPRDEWAGDTVGG